MCVFYLVIVIVWMIGFVGVVFVCDGFVIILWVIFYEEDFVNFEDNCIEGCVIWCVEWMVDVFVLLGDVMICGDVEIFV